jgi:hypothetical protein
MPRQQTVNGKGRGWHGDPEGHAAAGRIGGAKMALDREEMGRRGRIGGLARSKNPETMSAIGKLGAAARRARQAQQ